MIVVVATGTITELDCEEVSRLQPKIESINVRESVKTEEPNKSVITEDPVESSTVEEPKEPGIAEEPIDPATTEGPSETANSIDIITLLNSILLKDLIEPPDLTKENEAFIIEVEQDEKAYLEAIRKQQEIAAKQYEKERSVRRGLRRFKERMICYQVMKRNSQKQRKKKINDIPSMLSIWRKKERKL